MTYDHWKTTEPDPFELDEPPQRWTECPECDGKGYVVRRVTVYEHGCHFPHDDSDEMPCRHCSGLGGFIDDVEASTR